MSKKASDYVFSMPPEGAEDTRTIYLPLRDGAIEFALREAWRQAYIDLCAEAGITFNFSPPAAVPAQSKECEMSKTIKIQVSGPAGSGKSTLLAALAQAIINTGLLKDCKLDLSEQVEALPAASDTMGMVGSRFPWSNDLQADGINRSQPNGGRRANGGGIVGACAQQPPVPQPQIAYLVKPVVGHYQVVRESYNPDGQRETERVLATRLYGEDVAHEVAYALCNKERVDLGWPDFDNRMRYPAGRVPTSAAGQGVSGAEGCQSLNVQANRA